MAHYRTGTIALTNGLATVTGTGTDFISGAAIGECVSAPDGKLYEILSIQSATGLTLGTVYLGATASGQSYSIVPTQSYIRDLASQAATLVNDYYSVATGAGSGKFGDGTQAIPGVRFTADEDTGMRRTGANSMALVAAAADQLLVNANGVTVTAAAKTTPVDADSVMLVDSAASSVLKKLTWANLKATLLTWLQGTVFPSPGAIGATTPAAGSFTTLSATGALTTAGLKEDASGNLAVGGTPIGTTGSKLQMATASNGFVGLSANTGWAFAQDGGLEIQRWTGTGVNYNAVRIGTYGGSGVGFYQAAGAAIGSQTWVKSMDLDVSGNLGLGMPPSAWDPSQRAFDIGIAGALVGDTGRNTVLVTNGYYQYGWKYKSSNIAAIQVVGGDGSFSWLTAPSGTAGDPISFTQAMTLGASGNLLVGTTDASFGHHLAASTYNTLTLTNTYNTTAARSIYSKLGTNADDSGSYHLICETGGANRLFITGNGNVFNTNNSYGALSDLKLKENITDATPKLAGLMQVRVVNYNLKTDPLHKQIGVIAQELETIFPGLIEESPDTIEVTKTREVEVPEVPAVDAVLDDDGNVVTEAIDAIPATTSTEEYTEREATGEVTKSVKYSVFVPMLIKAMQEQQAQIEAMTARLTALEAA